MHRRGWAVFGLVVLVRMGATTNPASGAKGGGKGAMSFPVLQQSDDPVSS